MDKRIYLSSPHMSGKETKYIESAFAQNWIAPLGPNVDAFEKELASYTGSKHAAALSSGTAAIHLALILLGIRSGDKVLVPSFTFSATVNPVVYQGAIPVLVDSEPDTWNMDPELMEEAIKEDRQSGSRSIKAIILVHLYGMPAKLDRIMAIASTYEIPVIEDAAEALGSRYRDKLLGSFGKMSVLSFNGNKIITTSGGGALLSDKKELVQQARFLATQARDKAVHYQHSQIGYNYRMSNVLAGIGRGQLEVVQERVVQRRAVNERYRSLLSRIPGITFHTEPSSEFFSNYWLTCICIDPDDSGTDRERIRMALEKEDIEARPLWKPMHLQPVFKDVPNYINNTSERLFKIGLCLPSGSSLNEEEFSRIAEVLLVEFDQ